jgi:molecular chaperone GrpE
MTNEGYNDETDSALNTEDVFEALKKALDEEKAKAETNLAGWQRNQADFINYKRRCEQELSETTQFANAALLLSLLPVLDDFDRAFNSFPAELSRQDAGWVEGVKMVERKFRTTLERLGLSRIETANKPFDPALHEAVSQGKGKEGIIIQEVEKGYRLHNKVLRPAKVMVGIGENTVEEE